MGFRKARRLLDDFAPDFVVIWGDDQYENFKEDIIPPFCVMAYESFEVKPWEDRRGPNFWDEPKDKTFTYEADRALYEALRAGDYRKWRDTPLSAIEESGQQEMLNWMCLAGAMAELGRKPTETELVQTYIFNSSKCFA